MPDNFRSRNQLALIALIAGKLLGVGGLILGGAGQRVLGGMFLVIDGICIAIAVVCCLRNMRSRAVEEAGHKQILAQMIREGTLQQYLQDLRAEEAAPKILAEPPSKLPDDRPAFS